MKIWLDDERPAPDDSWTVVKTPWEAIELLKTNTVTRISLDNDLGLFNYAPPNEGYHVANWIEEAAFRGELKSLAITVHTSNPVAHTKIVMAIRNAYKIWKSNEPHTP